MNCMKCGAYNSEGAIVKPVKKHGKRGMIIGITAVAVAVIAITAVLLFTSNTAPVPGNTPMNIQNGGIAAESEGWIYYRNSADGNSLYKIRTDGTGKTKLNSDISLSINVIGGWVYYIDFSAKGSICKIRTDGTDSKILYEGGKVFQLYVHGDWMYYGEGPQGGSTMYRMRTDGTEKTALGALLSYFNITDGWIYYIDRSDSKNYKMRLDGTDKTEMGEIIVVTYLTLTDGWVYYNYGAHLSKMREDGTDLQKLSDDTALDINVADGWVYYLNLRDRCTYKVKTDGTEKTKLIDNGRMPNIVGDWIYYLNMDEQEAIYRMKTDGSENQAVE